MENVEEKLLNIVLYEHYEVYFTVLAILYAVYMYLYQSMYIMYVGCINL